MSLRAKLLFFIRPGENFKKAKGQEDQLPHYPPLSGAFVYKYNLTQLIIFICTNII